MKPKHGGTSAGDSPEQLLLEPCSGERTLAKACPVLVTVSTSVHMWGAWDLGGPFGSSSGEQGVQGPERLPVGGTWATRVEGASRRRHTCASVIVGLYDFGAHTSTALFLSGRVGVAALLTCVCWRAPRRAQSGFLEAVGEALG